MHKNLRARLLVAGAVAAALGLAAVTPALAAPAPSGAPHATTVAPASVQGDPRDATDRVADFYGAYIDAVWSTDDPAAGAQAKALRAFYLSPAARKKVAAYEAREHADGILFAQNVPVKWDVTYTGSGAGHSTARVTLTWSEGEHPEVSRIKVRSDLATGKITDLAQTG
ncbi:hypothetical protein GTW43_06425 [Streptomyces sp. SID5785]|uniref:hypothetical protein n=1 Tax=Streptomyces sp. SID5785 TaxID=2690309 RepID=UPI001360B85E|nr:hypothetical protein [Streptomyces sp. SID5785]MZD04721.1 hypothetical protein [Streptomyces sp. SID5785]